MSTSCGDSPSFRPTATSPLVGSPAHAGSTSAVSASAMASILRVPRRRVMTGPSSSNRPAGASVNEIGCVASPISAERLLRLDGDRARTVQDPVVPGDREHEVRSHTELRPDLERGRRADSHPTGRWRARVPCRRSCADARVGAPEAVEDPLRVGGLHPEAEISHPRRHGVLVAVDRDDDGTPLAVLDRVADQIAQHPAHAPRIHVDG